MKHKCLDVDVDLVKCKMVHGGVLSDDIKVDTILCSCTSSRGVVSAMKCHHFIVFSESKA
jgi:hypothetical protein